ncbi:MAG: hypothetical protein KF768_02025 [Phycisphaeraceae bacterium]|nr:hypothetical protein [Phycisphaeraceae bacterium]
MRTLSYATAILLIAAVTLLSLQTRSVATVPQAAQEAVLLRPAWQAGDRTHWQLEATQTMTAITEGGEAGAPHRDAQTLHMRVTVLAVAADGAATLGVAFERVVLSSADQSAEADGNLTPEPADEPERAEPGSLLADLARVFARCALRVEIAPDGQVHSLTGLERVREFMADHPDLATTLGPIGPGHMARTLESLWCFDPDQPGDKSASQPITPAPRRPGDRWSVSEPISLSFIGQATRVTDWTLTQITDALARLEATRRIALKPRDSEPSALTPAVNLAEQRHAVSADYDTTHRTARRLEQTATIVVATRLGQGVQSRSARTRLETILSVQRRAD